MIKIGMMIGDRYEILEKIGTGGMSDVYKAKCHKLNRYVAIKVLKQEFSENANFVSKFRIEAQAAAGLSHPNIVNVYDVGEENGIHYIVMELVEGITLKKYIEKKARLSYKEAVSIAIQVCMGIEAAHNNHIIHRDIKPQNIIISKDGKVKVTDFGIAKAATSNTITSNVMGSVHYTSPEQARGGFSDEKSDIYSLGITLFEALTGRVPFNGETTVAIAIKHIQEEMPSPRDFVPEIPSSVNSIVLKCCQKSPDRRYQNMHDLIVDLKRSLMNPDEDFVVQNDIDLEGSTKAISARDMEQIKSRVQYQKEQEYPEKMDTMRLKSEVEADYNEEETSEYDEEYDYNPKMEKMTTLLAVLAGVIVIIVILILALKLLRGGNENPTDPSKSPIIQTEESDATDQGQTVVTMPDVKGKMVEDARNTLLSLGLEVSVEYEESNTVDAGIVLGSNVSVGDNVTVGSVVILKASAGRKSVKVPSVVGLTYEEAQKMLTDLGLAVTKTDNYSDTYVEGVVCKQMPEAESSVPAGTNVSLFVSQGKQDVKVSVPNLMDLTEEEATKAIEDAKLTLGTISYEFSDTYEQGKVCYQSYSHGSMVEENTVIDIRISKGRQQATYKCNISIEAPSIQEAPDYSAGVNVYIQLVTDDGDVLLETNTTSFPQSANYYHLTSAAGTVYLRFTVSVPSTVDGDGNVTPGVLEERVVTRRVEFTLE